MAAPRIVWFRHDLRLADQAALAAAAAEGPIAPVFVLDEESAGARPYGGAARWWLHHSLAALDRSLQARGGRLLLLKGRAGEALARLAQTLGAEAIHACRMGEPWWPAIEAGLDKETGGRLMLHEGRTLLPTGSVTTSAGEPYRVFTPFARAAQEQLPPAPPRPGPRAPGFAAMPEALALEALGLLPRVDWAADFEGEPGEEGARQALERLPAIVPDYARRRDLPSEDGTSRLSPHLHWGEVSPARAWHEAARAGPAAAARDFQRQLLWRDFGHELAARFPQGQQRAHRPAMERLPWTDTASGEGRRWLIAWQQGRTGHALVDAGMRQLWRRGWMHNRVRMVTASFLTRHLLIDWREGERWFWDTLVDADWMNNVMGWQWVSGAGVDSQPFQRIFNPQTQAHKFDTAAYVREHVPERACLPDDRLLEPLDPIVTLAEGRRRALDALAAARRG